YSCVDFLLENEYLKKLNNGKIVIGYQNGPIIKNSETVGTIVFNTKGDGFFKEENQDFSSVYINKKNINNAMDGDKVKIVLMDLPKKESSTLKDGIVLEVVERNKNFFTALVIKNNGKYKIVADDEKNKKNIVLDNYSRLVDGYKILIKIANIKDDTIYGSVSKIIGHKNDVGTDILSIVFDNDIDPNFPEKVIQQANQVDFRFSLKEDSKRKDLSNLNIVTIDPQTSKDLDDAIYVEKHQDFFKLFVSIADVSFYLDLNTDLWKEAYKRATSIYLVDRVIPMIPHNLSNEICSLNPNEKRYSMTCEIEIDFHGNYRKIDVYLSIISSKRRFAYEEVNGFFSDEKSLGSDSIEIKKMLNQAKELFKILKNVREKKGSINFEIPESEILIDNNGKVIEVRPKKTGEAQMMIESFMVAANEAVTIKFKDIVKNIPFVYRTHDSPDFKKIEAFKIESNKLNFVYDSNLKKWKPNTVSKWLEKNANNPNKDLINTILLRTMAKAKYSISNIGHFGLALENYTHFTSPIRRFPDIIVHLLFRMFILEKEKYSNDQRYGLINSLEEICLHSTSAEIKAQIIEREVNSMKFAEYMESKVGEEFNGFVSYITSFGIFVQLDNTIEGLCKQENIDDDFYVFNEDDMTFLGKKTNRKITLGTKVKIKVLGANKLTRKIDFKIIKFL
ncbi:MAG: ribonuclease R, partial [Malacoplasma sp.]|nr:ribonuclease R [Malacoplasma sp.]